MLVTILQNMCSTTIPGRAAGVGAGWSVIPASLLWSSDSGPTGRAVWSGAGTTRNVEPN